MNNSVVEKTVEYRKAVETVPDAFAFIMSYLDELGDEPSIHITPAHIYNEESEDTYDGFYVVIQGVTAEGETE